MTVRDRLDRILISPGRVEINYPQFQLCTASEEQTLQWNCTPASLEDKVVSGH